MQENNYLDMGKRLYEYRKMLSMTREEVACILGVSPRCYNDFEEGSKSMLCDSFSKLHAFGWDVNYIITGVEEKSHSTLKEKLMSYGEWNERELILLFSWIFSNGIILEDAMEEEQRELELLQIITKGYDECHSRKQSLASIVRELLGQSQEVLAEHLNVCVKTYRKMEKNIAKSKVEFLARFCKLSGFRPSLFLNASAEWDIIEHIWSVLKEEDKKAVLQFVRMGIRMMKDNR